MRTILLVAIGCTIGCEQAARPIEATQAIEAPAKEPAPEASEPAELTELTEPDPPATEPDPALQSDRQRFVDKLIADGIVDRIEMPGTLPRVWVTDLFMGGRHAAQESVASVIYALHFPNPDPGFTTDHIKLINWQTGKDYGEFSLSGGLTVY